MLNVSSSTESRKDRVIRFLRKNNLYLLFLVTFFLLLSLSSEYLENQCRDDKLREVIYKGYGVMRFEFVRSSMQVGDPRIDENGHILIKFIDPTSGQIVNQILSEIDAGFQKEIGKSCSSISHWATAISLILSLLVSIVGIETKNKNELEVIEKGGRHED